MAHGWADPDEIGNGFAREWGEAQRRSQVRLLPPGCQGLQWRKGVGALRRWPAPESAQQTPLARDRRCRARNRPVSIPRGARALSGKSRMLFVTIASAPATSAHATTCLSLSSGRTIEPSRLSQPETDASSNASVMQPKRCSICIADSSGWSCVTALLASPRILSDQTGRYISRSARRSNVSAAVTGTRTHASKTTVKLCIATSQPTVRPPSVPSSAQQRLRPETRSNCRGLVRLLCESSLRVSPGGHPAAVV